VSKITSTLTAVRSSPQTSKNRLRAPPSVAAPPAILLSRDHSIAGYSLLATIFYFWSYIQLIYLITLTKLQVLIFFPLIVRYLDCCQRSVAVGKAVAELRIERIWL